MSPLVSIIIPTYNRPVLLRECLLQIADDPWPDKEVIVVNDAGSDVSSVIDSVRTKLSVRLLQLDASRGHVFARNEGLRAAHGDMIFLCDDDDVLLPGHISELAKTVHLHPNQLAYADAEIVTYDWDGHCRTIRGREPFAFDYDPHLLRQWNTVIPSTIAFHRSLRERIGDFDEAVYHYWDWDYVLRAAAQYPLRRVAQASVLYMVSAAGQNLSAQPATMAPYLAAFCKKHGLPQLPSSSFALMQSEPALAPLRATTTLLWDGEWPCPDLHAHERQS